jgi:hypothetical protein
MIWLRSCLAQCGLHDQSECNFPQFRRSTARAVKLNPGEWLYFNYILTGWHFNGAAWPAMEVHVVLTFACIHSRRAAAITPDDRRQGPCGGPQIHPTFRLLSRRDGIALLTLLRDLDHRSNNVMACTDTRDPARPHARITPVCDSSSPPRLWQSSPWSCRLRQAFRPSGCGDARCSLIR